MLLNTKINKPYHQSGLAVDWSKSITFETIILKRLILFNSSTKFDSTSITIYLSAMNQLLLRVKRSTEMIAYSSKGSPHMWLTSFQLHSVQISSSFPRFSYADHPTVQLADNLIRSCLRCDKRVQYIPEVDVVGGTSFTLLVCIIVIGAGYHLRRFLFR